MTTTDPAGEQRVVTSQFALLWTAGFSLFLSFFLLLPTLPTYARGLGIPEPRIGLLSGAFPLAAMLVRPVAGWAADRYGRRPLLLAGAVVFVVASLLYTGSGSLATLIAVRALHGVGMGLYPTAATAVAADLAPPARRGRALGLMGIAGNLALALGPLVGLWLVAWGGYPGVFGGAAALAAVTLVLTLGLRETLRDPVRVPLGWRSAFSGAAVYPSAIMLCLMITYGMQVTYLPLHAAAAGLNAGLFFTVMALTIILTRGTAGGVSDRVGRPPVVAAGSGLVAMGLVVLGTGGGPGRLALAGALYGLGLGVTQPGLAAWCVDRADPRARGRAMGTLYTGLELGIAAGSIGAGWVVARASYEAMFLLGAGVALAAAVLALAQVPRGRRA